MRVGSHVKMPARQTLSLVGVAFVAAGCSNAANEVDGVDSAPGTSAPGHIHNLALVAGELWMGAHNGMWKQAQGGEVSRVSRDAWDVMGLTKTPEAWLAGGHPGPDQSGPASLGLQKSGDGGQSWQAVSLVGDVDFHRLAVSGEVIVGLSSSDGALMISPDRGRSWKSTTDVPLVDITVDPRDPMVMVGTTQDGPVRSIDGGDTFMLVKAAPLIALVSWTGSSLYGVAPDGAVYASLDNGVTWDERGTVEGAPIAIAADGESLAVLANQVVVESADGGRTFKPRLTGLG